MKISSVAVITGALLNVALDPVFMFAWGLNLGVAGASMATTVSQFVTFGILTWFYLSGRSVIKLRVKAFRPSWRFVRDVAAIGIPTAVIQMCVPVRGGCADDPGVRVLHPGDEAHCIKEHGRASRGATPDPGGI